MITDLAKTLLGVNPIEARELIVKGGRYHIKGFGMKIASHFLRGIGASQNQLAILDSRTLNRLHGLGVIPKLQDTNLRPFAYRFLEEKVQIWAQEEGVPLDTLDLIVWRQEGEF